ncbi:hypothetical protein LBLM1_02850 [Limosilactobacillus mucosae LM1]|uniref:Uncharacterized protein n=1 Tax=Limosilactobacillus mucosae LM1 TaxID=1130798 RepID=A0A0D4CIZ1_LIMMU|nr:hypothetical protein [Limosilactobacillus mucosae]AJT50117.1 hypothetical protein LBLM1_02850 [Limosilactobacillus mucosae LM1]
MYESENLRDAIKTLFEYNTADFSKTIDGNGNERETQIEDLQDMNLTVLYVICDLLGFDETEL